MKISSFRGIRNTSPIRSIPNDALTDAVDIDMDNSTLDQRGLPSAGVITRRNGFTLSKSVSGITEAYSTQDKVSYLVANGVLNRIGEDLNLIPLASSTATHFCDSGKVLFTNDGLKVQNDTVINLSIPAPDLSGPSLSAAPGNWAAGTYSAVYTYRNAAGMEGHTSPNTTITLVDGQRVVVAPPPEIAEHTAIVYLTDADGTVYYDSTGAQLNPIQLLNDSFPSRATCLAWYACALWCAMPHASGSTVIVYSLPFMPHLFDFLTNYLIVPGEVRSMMEAGDVLIIATDSNIYAWDGTALTPLAAYGVPKGRSLIRTPDGQVKMFTYRGVCEAMPFANLTEKRALFPAGKQVSVALVDQGGIQKFLALSDGSGTAYNIRS